MSLATRLAAKVVDSLIGAQTLWLEYRTVAPAPANGELVGATCDANGNLNVAVAGGITLPNALDVEGTGTAGTPAGGVLTVQGVASGTALNVRGAAANQAAASGNPVPIAGYDSGNSGRTQVPDIDSNGAVRLQSGGTSGAAVPTRITQVGGSNGTNLYALKVSTAGVAHTVPGVGASYTSTAAEASGVVQASACAPARVSMTNGNAGTRYCLMFDATSLPSNGAIPKDSGGAQSTNARNFLIFPVPTARFTTGLVVTSSSTASSLTIGSADALFSVDLFPATA